MGRELEPELKLEPESELGTWAEAELAMYDK